ncbi:aspartate aminotransferase family protein [Thermodesulfobacteriota bacterium]
MYTINNSMDFSNELIKYMTLGEGSSGRSELFPLFIESGQGCRVFDVDGNEFIDYMLAYGPIILGHAHPAIVKAICDQTEKGTIFGHNNTLEIEVSRKIIELFPEMDQVRFNNTGTEAVQSALRVARVFTGKNKFLKFVGQYHGWLDNVLISGAATKYEDMGPYDAPNSVRISKGSPPSVLEDVLMAHWNDLDQVEKIVKKHKGELACIITEPMMSNAHIIPPKDGFLEGLKKIAHDNDVLLVFDEVVSGFRLSLRGGQGYFGVTPDITVFGKALGGGLPVSAFGARHEIMDVIGKDGAIQLGTFNTNPLCMAAANAALDEFIKDDGGIYPYMYELGEMLQNGIRSIFTKLGIEARIQGTKSLFAVLLTKDPVHNYEDTFRVDPKKLITYRRFLYEHGIMVRPEPKDIWYLSSAHTKVEIEKTLNILENALALLKE